MKFTKICIVSLLVLNSSYSAAQSCQEGLYVQGSQACTASEDACPNKYLYQVNCDGDQTQLKMLRASSTAKKYGYQAGDIRYQGNSSEGTFIQYFPTKQCGDPVRITTDAKLKFSNQSLEISYQRHRYNETRCKVKSNSAILKEITLLKVK